MPLHAGTAAGKTPTIVVDGPGVSLPRVVNLETKGERIEVDLLAVPGKRTIIAFEAGGTPASKFFHPFLERIGELDPSTAIRILDIDRPDFPSPDLESPIAKRYRISMENIPMIKVYDRRGNLELHGEAASAWLEGVAKRLPPPEHGSGPHAIPAMSLPVAEITNGNPVDVKPYMSTKNNTIVMFHSPFCPPCRRMRPFLEDLAERHDDFVLRKVDVNRPGFWGIDYRSPASIQHRVPFLPYIKVANAEGEYVSEGREAVQSLMQILDSLDRADAAKAANEAQAAENNQEDE